MEQPKGIEVVKEAIRRLQFTQQIKKAEGGAGVKMKKVEITVSVDGVAVQVSYSDQVQFKLYIILIFIIGTKNYEHSAPVPVAQDLVLCRREGCEEVF